MRAFATSPAVPACRASAPARHPGRSWNALWAWIVPTPTAANPIYDEAREHLYERTVIAALQETDRDVLELPGEPEWTSFQEGVGASYTVRLPVRPEVQLGDYTDYPFTPQVDEVTEEQIDAVVEQLRDQQASLVPVEDRAGAGGRLRGHQLRGAP